MGLFSWFGLGNDEEKEPETYHFTWIDDQYNDANEGVFQNIKPSKKKKPSDAIEAADSLPTPKRTKSVPKHCGKVIDSLNQAIEIFKKKEIKDCYLNSKNFENPPADYGNLINEQDYSLFYIGSKNLSVVSMEKDQNSWDNFCCEKDIPIKHCQITDSFKFNGCYTETYTENDQKTKTIAFTHLQATLPEGDCEKYKDQIGQGKMYKINEKGEKTFRCYSGKKAGAGDIILKALYIIWLIAFLSLVIYIIFRSFCSKKERSKSRKRKGEKEIYKTPLPLSTETDEIQADEYP